MARKDDKVGVLILGGILIFFLGRCSVTEPVPAPAPAALPVVAQEADDGALPSNATSIDPVAENPTEPVRAVEPQSLAETQAALDDPEETEACGFKTVCRQMESCEEAQHYLNDCGLSRLDRDNDGVACESLC